MQSPFSDSGSTNVISRNTSIPQQLSLELMFPGYVASKTVVHKMQRPKMSTILSSLDIGKSKNTYSKMKIRRNDNVISNELRLARNINKSIPEPSLSNRYLFSENQSRLSMENYYKIPTQSIFFPSIDDRELQSVELKTIGKDTITFPESIIDSTYENDTSLIKSIFIAKSKFKTDTFETSTSSINTENEKLDFLLEGLPVTPNSMYRYNYTSNPYTCISVNKIKSDIDVDEKFSEFDIEVCTSKTSPIKT